jgi:lipopolysaccharide export system protein LptA
MIMHSTISGEGDEPQVSGGNATFDRKTLVLTISDNVVARVKDFEVRGERIVVRMGDKTIATDVPVMISRDRAAADGTRRPTMVVRGKGVDADLALRTTTIRSAVQANLYDVSESFLAAEKDNEVRDVVITSDGPMTYEDLPHRVTFVEKVVLTAGPTTLRCNRLVFELTPGENADDVTGVKNVVAEGSVELVHEDLVARGEKLRWQEVWQEGTLTGDRCTLENDSFLVSGRELSLYRVNSRVEVNGPGELRWKGVQTVVQPGAAPPEPESAGLLQMSANDPMVITWLKSMTHDAEEQKAHCEGQVTASQKGSTLACETLELHLAEEQGQVRKIDAREKVELRDEWGGAGRRIRCDRLVWDAAQRVAVLRASEGRVVNFEIGHKTIVCAHIVFDQAQNALDCPAPGRLSLDPPEADTETAARGRRTEIKWQRMMHFAQGAEPRAMFDGSVTAESEGEVVEADTLKVRFDADLNPLSIDAIGHAVLESSSERVQPSGTDDQQTVPPAQAGRVTARRVTADELTIEPQSQLITSSTPGTLTILDAGEASGSISWQGGMRFDQKGRKATFDKEVVADMEGLVLETDTLTMTFSETDDLQNVSPVGNVHFVLKGSWDLRCRKAQAVFVGDSSLRQFIARDEVVVNDQERTLRSDLLTLGFRDSDDGEQPVITKATAEGNVRVQYAEMDVEAGGDRLEWTEEDDRYVLTGEPEAYLRARGMPTVKSRMIPIQRLTGKQAQ